MGLSKKFERLTPRGKKLVLLIFCLAMGGVSASLLVKAVHEPVGGSLQIDPIQTPRHATETGEPPGKSGAVFSPELVQEVKQFRHYLDSLRQDDHGRQVYDSLISARPGLIDSLAIVEQLLQSSQNK